MNQWHLLEILDTALQFSEGCGVCDELVPLNGDPPPAVRFPVRMDPFEFLAAISVGKIDGRTMVDLAYSEDSAAEVDMNVVMTGRGRFVEIQGTAERYSFDKKDFDEFLALGWQGIQSLVTLQKDLIGGLD